ncbi:putative c6 zinc finger domain protein [Diaporthe ampelina]|uniref:Putative c6 zinc finger domain protein n=1 Tax=Diaporthe ampelina TaxID=1214573 RepID=A0A0G2I6H3_9PEZI|nr:putative c6 zinc finger domain protein [Diaporthe ampelina]
MDGYMNIDPSDTVFYAQDGFTPRSGINEETGAAILEPVTRFTSAIFRSQAETLVMASVVADYIAWLRKAPPGGGIPTVDESPVYLGMLDNLEIRLRELCEMSQSRSAEALRELVAALGAIAPAGGAMAARLGNLEGDLQREAQERAEVFRSRYNPYN